MWNEGATFVRFAVVGIGNTLVDFGVFFLLTSMGMSYVLAQICSYSAGVVNSYIWNRTWTFRVQEKASAQQFFQFLILNLLSLGTTVVLLQLLQLTGLSLFMSKVIVTIAGMAINFIGSRFWVFSSERERGRR
ncbi:putative flippase GtrA [Anoxybacillus voinovskiensis]|uniref:Putative flippase GtrA n=1 Tax=Anoxybacteroides voinovskiense TaxID=230470 RepID=A0A840DI61_9BACL|nr:GtrA family protein [Anoxybacillus voinovskiensis]MBB4072430.1 putative flippase GtrA [Anoxybacillus voinovskiensis]GGJ57940.1 putative membrane protein YngA [Anoxybacillus voinovskiensis]